MSGTHLAVKLPHAAFNEIFIRNISYNMLAINAFHT